MMAIDFAFFLVITTFITGIIWLLDSVYLRAKRNKQQLDRGIDEELKEPLIVEYSKAFFPVLFIVLILRSFIMEPFRIPSGSMLPTLEVSDFILVNKYVYGLRLPVMNTKVVSIGEPERGDVVVFKFPQDPRIDFIKRVIGLPGDVIKYQDKQVYINDKPVPQEYLDDYSGDVPHKSLREPKVYKENLPNAKHNILIYPNSVSQFVEIKIPEGKYFVMGDNRDDSNDSRYWGFVPEKNLVGKAVKIWLHWDFKTDFNWRRIGLSID